MKNNNSVIFAVVNRNGKALLINGSTKQYSQYNHDNSQKASMLAICKLLDRISNESNKYDSITILVPKNLAFILRKESVYEWINNGYKTNKGTILEAEFIELCKYISDMRNYLGAKRVKVKMTGTPIMTPAEELLMKQAWNQLDKLTNHKYNNKNSNKPVMPKSIANKLA